MMAEASLELEGLRGVDDVGGGEAVVQPAGGFGIGRCVRRRRW